MQKVAMGKEAKTNTESQAGLDVARGGYLGLSAIRRRQSGAGFPSRTLNGEDGGGFHSSAITLASF